MREPLLRSAARAWRSAWGWNKLPMFGPVTNYDATLVRHVGYGLTQPFGQRVFCTFLVNQATDRRARWRVFFLVMCKIYRDVTHSSGLQAHDGRSRNALKTGENGGQSSTRYKFLGLLRRRVAPFGKQSSQQDLRSNRTDSPLSFLFE
jgi:hypothetical protein